MIPSSKCFMDGTHMMTLTKVKADSDRKREEINNMNPNINKIGFWTIQLRKMFFGRNQHLE